MQPSTKDVNFNKQTHKQYEEWLKYNYRSSEELNGCTESSSSSVSSLFKPGSVLREVAVPRTLWSLGQVFRSVMGPTVAVVARFSEELDTQNAEIFWKSGHYFGS